VAAVLGISGNYHDAAAALVVDGKVRAALQEERLSRIKNDSGLPLRAARWCLQEAGLAAQDLDAVVFYESPFRKLERVLVSLLRAFPESITQLPRALSSQWSSKIWVLDVLSEELGVPRQRVSHAAHHESHAASAFLLSPFENAAVLTVDGVGEYATTALWKGDGDRLSLLSQLEFPHSLGLLYSALTAYLGFEVNEGEYKVMGLAGFGTPRYRDKFARLIELHRDGSFELNLDYFNFADDRNGAFRSALEHLLGPKRDYGTPLDFAPNNEAQRYADIAASLQLVTEEALLGLARRLREETQADTLCIAGGVALNALANRRLQRESGFERIFVQPAAGDAGAALGAALIGAQRLGDPRPDALRSTALGCRCDVGRAAQLAKQLGLQVVRSDDPAKLAARYINEGRVIAWVQGRSEFGPRALGQRSLLCRPDELSYKERLNRAIKRREPFRPFAPAVLHDAASTWFEDAPNEMTPFMTTVCTVKQPERLAAVTHVDGTARVQSVNPEHCAPFAAVLTELQQLGLPPIALNTSLNGKGEPIATTEVDALSFLCTHAVGTLLLEDLVITKPTLNDAAMSDTGLETPVELP
jgi:carbamoyltransferase